MKNKSKEQNKLSSQRAITLIALVVTIVVLLILAGVSLNLVLGNNGIINKAQEAKVETRAGVVDDEVNLWKTDNYLADNTNSAAETDKEMITRLRENKLITEDDEVDTENKKIIIKKKDGTVVREISYEYEKVSNVKINISKTPESGDTSAVVLQVTSVEGLINFKIEKEEDEIAFKSYINNMESNQKRELFKTLLVELANYQGDFDYVIEEELLNSISEKEMNEDILYCISCLHYDQNLGEIKMYSILNPDNENSDYYIATSNGTYTFTVKDILTDKTYTKKVEVDNITSGDHGDFKVGIIEGTKIGLLEKSNEQPTSFEEIYIIYNNELVKLSKENNQFYSYDWLSQYDLPKQLISLGKIADESEIIKTNQDFLIVKDGEWYRGTVWLDELPM